jgi:cysteine desulfurase
VLEPCRQLEREGVDVEYVSPGADGLVNAAALAARIRPETVLVSVMHANNETGAIQPVSEIAAGIRERREEGQRIYLHCDGVQAFGKIPFGIADLGADLYSLSAHKIFGPKGVGALYVRKGVPLRAVQFGGRHERERRAGTENVPGAVAFACAVELCRADDCTRMAELRNWFECEIERRVEDVEVNGRGAPRLPNTSNLLFRNVSGENLVIALDMAGFAVSSGSACSSGSVEPSHVLLAMGRSREDARSSVRFSFGRYNTREEVDTLIHAVVRSVERLRKSVRKEVTLAV